MSASRLVLIFGGAAVIAVIAGVVTAFVVARRGSDGPSEPHDPVTLMFCEPLRGMGLDSAKVAVVPSDAKVIYSKEGCTPDVNDTGGVAATDASGSTIYVTPTYVDVHTAPRDNIVWTPAKGVLAGAQVVMTGRYLKPDALVTFDVLGQPSLVFNMTDDGQQVFGSLSERLIGYPLAMFVDGVPVRSASGGVTAPTIQSRISDGGQTTGLELGDAKRLAAVINNGLAQ